MQVYAWGCAPPLSNSTFMGPPSRSLPAVHSRARFTLPDQPSYCPQQRSEPFSKGAGTRSGGLSTRERRAWVQITDSLQKRRLWFGNSFIASEERTF